MVSTLKTDSTAMGDNSLLFPLTIFDDNEVFTQLIKSSFFFRSTALVMVFNTSKDLSKAN